MKLSFFYLMKFFILLFYEGNFHFKLSLLLMIFQMVIQDIVFQYILYFYFYNLSFLLF